MEVLEIGLEFRLVVLPCHPPSTPGAALRLSAKNAVRSVSTLSMSPFGRHIAATVQPIKSTLLALFFLSVGLPVDLRIVSFTWAPLLLNAAAILLMKSAVVFGLALALGVTRADALRLALALSQCGEFGFVLFGAAQAGGLMTAERVALASVLITISMLAPPFLVRLGDRLQPIAGTVR